MDPEQTQSDLGPHFLPLRHVNNSADEKVDDFCCDWRFKS